jgi:hypothetical protein
MSSNQFINRSIHHIDQSKIRFVLKHGPVLKQTVFQEQYF